MKRFLVILQLVLPLISFGQSNYKKGYILNSAKDTIAGFIDYREQNNNPTSINFKTSLIDKGQVLGLKDIIAYSIQGIERHEKHILKISLSKTSSADLSLGIDTSSKIDTVFLKVLEHGKNVTLFSYQDDIKLRYYILEKDCTVPIELIRNLYHDPQNASVTLIQNKYINQLQELIRKFNLVMSEGKFNNIKFYNNDLIKISAFINSNVPEKSRFSSTRFFAGAGVSVSKAEYSGTNDLNSSTTTSSISTMPAVNLGIDIFFNPAVKKLIFRTELSLLLGKYSLSVASSEQTKALITHEFNQSVVNLAPQLIYNFYNADKIKVFAGAGLGLNFSSYNKNLRTRFNTLNGETFNMEEVKLEKFYFSFPVNVGVVVNKRVEFVLGASLPEAISDYLDFSVEIKRYRFCIRYLFGKP
jgi:hypothetical protein